MFWSSFNIKTSNQIHEKELLHKEIHHRVKNNLQLVSSLMGLQSRNADSEHISKAISVGKSRVEAITLIHQNLFTEDHETMVNIEEYLTKLIANLSSTYNSQLEGIQLTSLKVNVDPDTATCA